MNRTRRLNPEPRTLFSFVVPLLLLLAPALAAGENEFRFVVMSDTHVGENDTAWLSRYTNMANEIIHAVPKPVAVFGTGDLTHQGLESEYDHFSDWIITPLTNAGIPFYGVNGNHELGGDAPHNTLAMWTNKLGALYQAVSIQKTFFLLTSGNPEGVTGGYGLKSSPSMPYGIGQAGSIDSNQLAWIGAQLLSGPATNAFITLVMNHFPLWQEDYGGYAIHDLDWFGNATGAGTSLRGWMDRPGANLFLCGHRHYRSAPFLKTYASGRTALHVLNERTTWNGFGYEVYDVAGTNLTHYRKTIHSLVPENIFSYPATNLPLAYPPVGYVPPDTSTNGGVLVWDPAHGATNAWGGSGNWNSPTGWYNGSNWTAWVETNDAVFKGAAGLVAFGATPASRKVRGFHVETDGYRFDLNAAAGFTLYVSNFSGSSGMLFTNTSSSNRIFYLAALNTKRATYAGGFSGRGNGANGITVHIASGLVELNGQTNAMPNFYSFYADATALVNTAFFPYLDTHTYVNGTLGGTSAFASAISIGKTLEVRGGAVLSPGDPDANNGIGTLGVGQFVAFLKSTTSANPAVFRVELASATDYDQLRVTGSNANTGERYTVNTAATSGGNVYTARIDTIFLPGFAGGASNQFLCMIDNQTTGHHSPITNWFVNAPPLSTVTFTNAAKVVYTFQYRYNVEKTNAALPGNDFGLLIQSVVRPNWKGALLMVK